MERYILELSKSLLLSCKEKRPIDIQFLSELIKIIVTYNKLEQYYNGIEIKDEFNEHECVADYGNFSKIITLYMPQFLELLKDIKDGVLLKKIDQECLPCFAATQTILHELEHARAIKVEGQSESIESKILLATTVNKSNQYLREQFKRRNLSDKEMETYFKIRKEKYKIYYEFSPRERLAEHNSILIILEVFKSFETTNPFLIHLCNYFVFRFYSNLLRGYDKTTNPTKVYLKSINAKEELREIKALSRSLSLAERLKLGLEISDKEYNEILNRKRKIINKVIR